MGFRREEVQHGEHKNPELLTGHDTTRGSGLAFQNLDHRGGSDQEMFEISRIGWGVGRGSFEFHGTGRVGSGHPDPSRPVRSDPTCENPCENPSGRDATLVPW